MTVLLNEVEIERLALKHYFGECEAAGGRPMQPSGGGVVVEDHLVTISNSSKALARYIWSGDDEEDIEFTELMEADILRAAYEHRACLENLELSMDNIVTMTDLKLIVGPSGELDFEWA